MSVLFTRSTTGTSISLKRFIRFSSIGPILSPAETIYRIRSTPVAASDAARIIKDPSLSCGLCIPGVSRKTYCVSPLEVIPVIFVRVVCGLFDTMAIFSPSKVLSRVDLPVFALPIIAVNIVFFIYFLSCPIDDNIASCLSCISLSSSSLRSWS